MFRIFRICVNHIDCNELYASGMLTERGSERREIRDVFEPNKNPVVYLYL